MDSFEISKVVEPLAGNLKEILRQPGFTVHHAAITGKEQLHFHRSMDEFYFVINGTGKLCIGRDCFYLKQGDYYFVPRNTEHYLERLSEINLEILLVASPQYDAGDVTCHQAGNL